MLVVLKQLKDCHSVIIFIIRLAIYDSGKQANSKLNQLTQCLCKHYSYTLQSTEVIICQHHSQ